MKLRVVRDGLVDSIRDRGRFGHQHLGITPSGWMDEEAARTANAIVGNNPYTPVIESGFPAAALLVEESGLLAITGADFMPLLDEKPVALNTPLWAPRGALLRFAAPASGSWTYIAVHGILRADPWLGSHSLDARAGMGGVFGRALQKEDELWWDDEAAMENFRPVRWSAAFTRNDDAIRIMPNQEIAIPGGACTIGRQSDRMGYRLDGPSVPLPEKSFAALSCAVTFGTVQVLPSGQLLVLMADHQTTGGYPVAGHVFSADLGKLAQKRAGETIRFIPGSEQDARSALAARERDLKILEEACLLKLEERIKK